VPERGRQVDAHVADLKTVPAAEVEEALVEVEIRVTEPAGEHPNADLRSDRHWVVQLPLDEIGAELL